MRICLLSAEYPPAHGGVGDYTRLLAVQLARGGDECSVLTSLKPGARDEDDGEFPVHRLVPDWGFGAWRRIAEHVRTYRPDVLHVQYQTAAYRMHPAINLLPWRLRAAGAPVRTVVTFHDLRVPYLFPKAGAARHLPALMLAAGCRAVVLVAEEHWQETPLAWLRRLPSSLPTKTYVIPIGSNIPYQPPRGFDRESYRARLGVGADEVLLVYFGFLNESKGVEDLLSALSRLDQNEERYRLLMVGGGGDDSFAANSAYGRKIRTLIETLGLQHKIIRTGFTGPAEVSAGLLAADICVLPFRDGGTFQRGTLLAALEHGLPIVSTRPPTGQVRVRVPLPNAGMAPRLAHGENIWLVEPRQPAALAEAISLLGRDRERRERLGAGARKLAAG
ncbi:MAG: glycosyltransferase family 4 protein, partial [Chloroflexota bacterium]